ncbi:MAG TPA: hypothetical protein VFZ12_05560, partial [Dehalococcoidia bacterium]|nr:hypothetical protein [Dehalococcoidia bacterium]
GVPVASALFGGSATVSGNSFTTDELDPPNGVSATANGADIGLSWTPTVDAYADGYRVFRSASSGGPYTQIDQVAGQATATHTDINPGSGTFYYVVRSFYEQWESDNSGEASATLP